MNRFLYSIFVLILTIFPITQSFAQSDEFYCIEIYPCDDNGFLLPEYSDVNNPCYEHFASQCKAVDTCDDLQGTIKILSFENQGLYQENEYLKKKIRVIRRKYRNSNE